MSADIDAAYRVLNASTRGVTKRDRRRLLLEGARRELMAVGSSAPDVVVLVGAALELEMAWDEAAACFVMRRIANHFHDKVPMFSCCPPWVCIHTDAASPLLVDLTRPVSVEQLASQAFAHSPHFFEVRSSDVLAFYTVACAKFSALAM